MSIYPPVRDDLARLLSKPRLDQYRSPVAGDLDEALALYAWNLQASSAFFESIHYFEVALRNTLDQALQQWAESMGAECPWYYAADVPLSDRSRSTVRKAVGHATHSGQRPELHGRVVAELGLGFWGGLLGQSYARSLWQPCLRHAFPTSRVTRLHAEIDQIRLLRNRIAHHEPIHHRDLRLEYTNVF